MIKYIPILYIVIFSSFSGILTTAHAEPLNVAVKQAPPFVMKNDAGEWDGLSVFLWQQIATDLNLDYQFKEHDLVGMLSSLEKSESDIGVGAITITEQRESVLDFTHTFFSTGLGIATTAQAGSIFSIIKQVFSEKFVTAIFALSIVLLITGLLIWIFERKANPDQFGGSAASGIGSGFWWSAVTMTTVGYGDKAPVTLAGRLLGLVWMFASIITISGFTAAIASAFTINSLEGKVSSAEDLPRVVTAVIKGSTSEKMMQERHYKYNPYPDLNAAFKALERGAVDAVVHDRPLLQYWVTQNEVEKIQVLPDLLDTQHYALGMKSDMSLREEINRVLLKTLSSEEWNMKKTEYLGGY